MINTDYLQPPICSSRETVNHPRTLYNQTTQVLTSDGEFRTEILKPYWKVPPIPAMKMAATSTGLLPCKKRTIFDENELDNQTVM